MTIFRNFKFHKIKGFAHILSDIETKLDSHIYTNSIFQNCFPKVSCIFFGDTKTPKNNHENPWGIHENYFCKSGNHFKTPRYNFVFESLATHVILYVAKMRIGKLKKMHK